MRMLKTAHARGRPTFVVRREDICRKVAKLLLCELTAMLVYKSLQVRLAMLRIALRNICGR